MFKVSYKTRQKLQRAIQQEIRKLGLIDTQAMYDSIRVSSVVGDLNKIDITINAIYYYVFQDLGTVNIGASDITRNALNAPNGIAFLDGVMQEYMDFLQKTYPILDVARLKIDPQINLVYNVFGDPTGQYNGIYDPSITFKIN